MSVTRSGVIGDYASAVRFGVGRGGDATNARRAPESDGGAVNGCSDSKTYSKVSDDAQTVDTVTPVVRLPEPRASCASLPTWTTDKNINSNSRTYAVDASQSVPDQGVSTVETATLDNRQSVICSRVSSSDGGAQPTVSNMLLTAKPYIPSYLAALKKPVQPGGAGAPPIRVSDRPKLDWMTCSTMSNSVIDQESTSSWADDDENFLLSVTKTQSSMHVKARGGKGSGEQANRQASLREKSRPAQGKGGKGASGASAEKGAAQSKRGANHKMSGHPPRPRIGSTNNDRNNNDNTVKNNNDRHTLSSTVLSGGRFDVLANPTYMRHL